MKTEELSLEEKFAELTKKFKHLELAAKLMRDAMRTRPEVWNSAIDYYDFIQKENYDRN